MSNGLRFRCDRCGEIHEGVPAFGWDWPIQYLQVPEAERPARCRLDADACSIDDRFHFVRGSLEVPVIGSATALAWGVWVSLSEERFRQWQAIPAGRQGTAGSFTGWLCSHIRVYPETLDLKARLHPRADGRPLVELEPTDHPLAVEQREGITAARVREIWIGMLHGREGERR